MTPSRSLQPGYSEAATSPLAPIFSPRSIAFIGATDRGGSLGRAILANILASPFSAITQFVNPNRTEVCGRSTHATIAACGPVDLAVIAVRAELVPQVMADCAKVGVRAALVIASGFRECGPAGEQMEKQIAEIARLSHMRVIGPNCMGILRPSTQLNLSIATQEAKPGSVAFVSQSGALCSAVLDWSVRENVGFSTFVSIGQMADVGWGDVIDFLGDDPYTKSILLYMETIGDVRSLISAARQVALTKPIIAMKAGRTPDGARAAATHTGTMTGSDDVIDAAFRRCGVLRVATIADLFYMAEVLGKQPRPTGPRLAIVTNAGGAGVMATDALIANGGRLAELSPETVSHLDQLLPPVVHRGNPLDLLNDASPGHYDSAVRAVARDPNTDAVLVVLAPQAVTDSTASAEAVARASQAIRKPMLASWMGGRGVEQGEQLLNAADVPTFPYPDTAARVFTYMWQYTYYLRSIYETPAAPAVERNASRSAAEALLNDTRAKGRTILAEHEAKALLAAYGFHVNHTVPARDEAAAVAAAREMGYPVVLKLLSHTVTHKAEVGGVQLDLRSDDEVRTAFHAILSRAGEHFEGVTVQRMLRSWGSELLVGSACDPKFGPIVMFGLGGTRTEVLRDISIGLPPLTTTLARRVMERTRIYQSLCQSPETVNQLEQLLVLFSEIVAEQRRICSIEVNPLLVLDDQQLVLDARVVLYSSDIEDKDLPRPAISSYPAHLEKIFRMRSGQEVLIRPIRPEDEPMMVAFHKSLSEPSVYQRYLHPFKLAHRIEHDRLSRLCFINYDREMAFVAELRDAGAGTNRIIGVGRLTRTINSPAAEFAIVVSDAYQRQGLGAELLYRLINIAKAQNVQVILGHILADNYEMQRLCERVGFQMIRTLNDPVVKATMVVE